MDILKLNFTVFNYCGLWWPDQTASSKKYFHTISTILMLSMLYIFTLMQLLDMILGNYKIDEMTDNAFMLLTMLSLCFKVTNFVLRRNSIIKLLNTLHKDICLPQNDAEANIQKRFDDIARSNTICFAILVDLTCVGFFAFPILSKSYQRRILPFKVSLPYSLSNLYVYWVMYAQQTISMAIASNLNVVSDTLVSGFLIQACAQLDILKDRIINMVKLLVTEDVLGQSFRSDAIYERAESTIRKCVQHHIIIYKFAARVQSSFGWIMFFQFFVSIVTLCSSVFKLSKKDIAGMEIASLVGYLACLLLQLLFYCWHGNEVKLKSLSVSDAAFAAEWTLLRPKTIKSLTTLMARSIMPIRITCGSMFTLSLETYGMGHFQTLTIVNTVYERKTPLKRQYIFQIVLKTSYSAFNVLHKA